jgi:hypothetical protein
VVQSVIYGVYCMLSIGGVMFVVFWLCKVLSMVCTVCYLLVVYCLPSFGCVKCYLWCVRYVVYVV